jgi:hypothetical protein
MHISIIGLGAIILSLIVDILLIPDDSVLGTFPLPAISLLWTKVMVSFLVGQVLLSNLNLFILDCLLENIVSIEHFFIVSLAVSPKLSLRIWVGLQVSSLIILL